MRAFGYEIETFALEYLKIKNFQLIIRNFQCKQGEIDLIGTMNDILMFVEVRFRKDLGFGNAADSITPNKKKRLRRTAQYFLQKRTDLLQHSCRFDVIAVTLKQGDYVIDWFIDAFQ